MKIIVCMKQVPATAHVEVDEETGVLKRNGTDSKTNPYDLFALETALRIREKTGGTITVLTMGPPQAESMVRDAIMCGADNAAILSDKKFAGSDVLATSYTLAQGIRALGGADIILCGKQTTDGDTAQVGPAIAEHLNLPHAAWVRKLLEIDESSIQIEQNLGTSIQTSVIQCPCVLTVDKDIYTPRLPSYRRKEKSELAAIRMLGFDDLPDQNLSKYGLIGSPTTVQRIFAPEGNAAQQWIDGSAKEQAAAVCSILTQEKMI